MPPSFRLGVAALLLMTAASAIGSSGKARSPVTTLPAPVVDGKLSLEAALTRRASIREFSASPISLADAGQLLWAAQGVTHEGRKRTAPSAGATYPLEIHLMAAAVEGLAPGIYRYHAGSHGLELARAGNPLPELADVVPGQGSIGTAAAVLLLTAIPARTAAKYGERGLRYVYIEAGHAAQNALLQAVARGLAAFPVGAFRDADISRLLALPGGEQPVYLIPVGKPAAALKR
jgi:SagB-type dehydrogenase family enzyme